MPKKTPGEMREEAARLRSVARSKPGSQLGQAERMGHHADSWDQTADMIESHDAMAARIEASNASVAAEVRQLRNSLRRRS